jgi:hypothetical protein
MGMRSNPATAFHVPVVPSAGVWLGYVLRKGWPLLAEEPVEHPAAERVDADA